MRGTENALEALDDADGGFTVYTSRPDGGDVHAGFFGIYQTIQTIMRVPGAGPSDPVGAHVLQGSFAKQIETVVAAHTPTPPPGAAAPKMRVTAAAHSLGAALTMLLIPDAKNHSSYDIPLFCSFGSPRVGDQTFVNMWDACGTESWRIVNHRDQVPQVPRTWMGYADIGGYVEVDSGDKTKHTLSCYHALSTYLVLIGDPTAKIGDECTPNAAAVYATAKVSPAAPK